MDTPLQNNSNPDHLELPHTKPDSFLKVALFAALVACGMALYLFWQNQQLSYQLAVSRQVLTSPSPVPSADPTADWQTYTNTMQNLTFKYPDTWKLTETPGSLDNGRVLNQNVTLSHSPASISMNLNMDGIGGKGMDLQGTPFTLSGVSLYKYRSDMENGNILIGLTDTLKTSLGVFQYQGKTYSISLVYPGNDSSYNYEADFEQILSTLKFTDSQPTFSAIKENDLVTSPVTIKGTVPTGWMFEGQFPIEIRDGADKVVGSGVGKEVTPGTWTSGEPVAFSALIDFQPTGSTGSIVLLSDNPSGLPENQKTFTLPVKFK